MNNMFNGMFGNIAPGMCKYSMDGKIAIRTSNGYKTFDVETKSLVNCSDFAFDVGENFFFLIPTNKVEKGDIILVGGKPHAVLEAKGNGIEVFNYETSAIATIVPENYVFMGNTYFYGKIVSMFGGMNKKGGMKSMMKYMMLSQMMKGNGSGNNLGNMLPFMLMGNDFSDMFSGMFGEDSEEGDAE